MRPAAAWGEQEARRGAGAQEGAVGSSGHGRVPGKLSKAVCSACRVGAGVLLGLLWAQVQVSSFFLA